MLNNKHLTLGVDIDMDEVMPTVERILVGKVRNWPWGQQALTKWMHTT